MKKVLTIFVMTSAVLFVLARPALAAALKAETMKPALLVIDVQNEFLPGMSEHDKKTAFDYINGAIRRFHDKGFPANCIYQSNLKLVERGLRVPEIGEHKARRPDDHQSLFQRLQ